MLQIITGKFFNTDNLHKTLHRGVYFTNYRSFNGEPLDTKVGRLLPSTAWTGVRCFTFEITEQLPKINDDGTLAGMVSVGGDQIENDFAAIASFSLNITCTPSHDLARRLLTAKHPSLGVSEVPQKYVRRMFDSEITSQAQDAVYFREFVDDLMALERCTYEGAMRAIRRFIVGCHRIPDDLGLAYAMLVMSMESLAQNFDGYKAVWNDYDAGKRKKVDAALAKADPGMAQSVREAILSVEHIAIRRRFCDFVIDHIEPTFFREEAVGATWPIGRPDLIVALKTAYQIRSHYVHTLEEPPKELQLGSGQIDAVRVGDKPVLTLQGLTRVARHVISTFIRRGAKVQVEKFDFRSAYPNVVRVRLAPKYWIWQADNFSYKNEANYLTGFLEQISSIIRGDKDKLLTNITEVMERIEKIAPSEKSIVRRLPMITLYYLFNSLAQKHSRRPGYDDFIKLYLMDFDAPSICSFVAHILTEQDVDWTFVQMEAMYVEYFRRRYECDFVQLPVLFECALALSVAERARKEDIEERAAEFVGFAVEIDPSIETLRKFEDTMPVPLPEISWKTLLLPATSPIQNTTDQKLI